MTTSSPLPDASVRIAVENGCVSQPWYKFFSRQPSGGDIPGLADAAETTAGTSTTDAVTPDGLAHSDYGKTIVSILVFDKGTNVATGDDAGDVFWRVPAPLNGWNLVSVAGTHAVAGSGTGTTTIQINNDSSGNDMLSTRLTIDSGERDSSTAAAAAVIDTAHDDVSTGQQLRIDVDAIPNATAPMGLMVELEFQLP